MQYNNIFKIDGISIGDNFRPYIIAELSANHANDINIAKKTIIEAKRCGADAIKIQTYSAETMTLDCKMEHFQAKGAWEGIYLYDLYKDAAMPWEWTQELQNVAKEVGITLFSTPFDLSSVEFLESLDMPAYKIASPEIVDIPLLKAVAKTKKPIIISTGTASMSQLNDACEVLLKEGVKDLAILKCTSQYPAPAKEINLKTIPFLKELYKCPIGLSDHTLGSAIPIGSVSIGANIIEKHFILDRSIKTADSFFSATPDELKAIVEGSRLVYDALGEVDMPILAQKTHRSLVVIKDMQKGELFKMGYNFQSLRPGGGLDIKYSDIIEGKSSNQDIKKGELLDWKFIG